MSEPVVARLRAAGCVFAEDEAALLLAAPGDVAALVDRRVAGEPLETVLGWVEFAGRRLSVGAGVFVPRRRTELLARLAVARSAPDAVVVELCCGVAAVAATVLSAAAVGELWAADVDAAAVAHAETNLAPWPQAHAVVGDLFAPLPPTLRGRVDIVVANAPYVPTEAIAFMPPEARDHEPAVALDGGPDGAVLHRRIGAEVLGWLRPGGAVLIETSRAQVELTAAALSGLDTTVVRDDDLDSTVVVGSAPPGHAAPDASLPAPR